MDERAIITQCLRGDPGAFRHIIDRHRPPLMAAAMTVLGNRQDAEDICQETFIQAYRHLEDFDSHRELRPWLYTILYRRCLNAVKRRKRFAGLVSRLKTSSGAGGPAPGSNPAGTDILPGGIAEALDPRERTVLSLWVNEGYTAKEIATILGCPAGTARYHLFNIRKKIRILREKAHESLSDR